jgi:hypothetical protein
VTPHQFTTEFTISISFSKVYKQRARASCRSTGSTHYESQHMIIWSELASFYWDYCISTNQLWDLNKGPRWFGLTGSWAHAVMFSLGITNASFLPPIVKKDVWLRFMRLIRRNVYLSSLVIRNVELADAVGFGLSTVTCPFSQVPPRSRTWRTPNSGSYFHVKEHVSCNWC